MVSWQAAPDGSDLLPSQAVPHGSDLLPHQAVDGSDVLLCQGSSVVAVGAVALLRHLEHCDLARGQ